MNRTINRIIIVVGVLILTVVGVYAIFFAEPVKEPYDIDYNSQDGIITIGFQSGPIEEGTWTADVFYENPERIYVASNVPVTISGDRMTATISSKDLVNLYNFQHTIYLMSSGKSTQVIHFTVSDHDDTAWDTFGFIFAIIFFVSVGGFLIARRIIYGKRAGWSYYKRI